MKIKLSISKIILLFAILIQFTTMFLKILFVSNYHNPEIGTIITGFCWINAKLYDYDIYVYPVTGIMNLTWIGVNIVFLFKTFNRKIIYNFMEIINLLIIFIILFLSFCITRFIGENSEDENRVFWYSGLYVLLASFATYFVAYFLFAVRNNSVENNMK